MPVSSAARGLTGSNFKLNRRRCRLYEMDRQLAQCGLFYRAPFCLRCWRSSPGSSAGPGWCLVFSGFFVFGMLGINIGYHRLLTHRAFTCPKWVERTLSVLGCCCGQDSPAYWVAIHRRHHHHTDDASDPHSPMHGFFWGHVGWLVIKSDDLDRHPLMDRYAKDIRRDPFQAWLVKSDNWIFIAIASWLLFFVGGFSFAALTGSSLVGCVPVRIERADLGRDRCERCWCCTSPGWSIRPPTCGAIAITQTPDDSRNNYGWRS